MRRRPAAAWTRRRLRVRLVVLAAAGIVVLLATFWAASSIGLRELQGQIVAEHRLLARVVAERMDDTLGTELEVLQSVASTASADDTFLQRAPDRAALREAYLLARLIDRIFLVGPDGQVRWEEPGAGPPTTLPAPAMAAVKEALTTGKATVTGVFEKAGEPGHVLALVPVRSRSGSVVGAVGGILDPERPRLAASLRALRPLWDGSIDLVDANGVVLVTSDPKRLYHRAPHSARAMALGPERREGGTCSDCHDGAAVRGHPSEVLAFASLQLAPWLVTVRQSAPEALAPVVGMRWRLLALGPVLLVVATILAWGAARSVRQPLAVLTDSAERIARGELGRPIPNLGEDEIGVLGRSLDTMRAALSESLARVERANAELEQRVEERTHELRHLNEELRQREELRQQLLRKVMTAQEDERKRIARELHDQTCQMLSAITLRLDAAATGLPPSVFQAGLGEAITLARRALDELRQVIYDLRPSLLDDLGLASAIRWCAEHHLAARGISVRCDCDALAERRLPPDMEIALFRVVQEALVNVARHAHAQRAVVETTFEGDRLTITIEDDGDGFDPAEVARPRPDGKGLGLMGIRERVEIIGGEVDVQSSPGAGARLAVSVRVPADAMKEAAHA